MDDLISSVGSEMQLQKWQKSTVKVVHVLFVIIIGCDMSSYVIFGSDFRE